MQLIDPITEATAAEWGYLGDRVMGGVSSGKMRFGREGDTGFLRLTGHVSTANNGGFIQMRRALDAPLPPGAGGLVVQVRGNGARYFVHLRVEGAGRPWLYYQAGFDSGPDWAETRLPFADFVPSGAGLPAALRPQDVLSIGIAAYGRDHEADVSLATLFAY
ncbi:hypothetical protein Ga0609869_001209 [Rhodovulum iodosum]|uniref:NADH:ubiquinone oxidoreductase intermediate-associated protein 30 domain-containing protein n=1 Tax=Rhodovulum iodosum TaxID=68291 RepID=A0ABV3XRB0_9RHOB|nr:CIA30 family protein [Rhodovulum robiginosum]RSK32732.1 NADH ubiquinone oxidoreductase [Rhodovulum robiginosum]